MTKKENDILSGEFRIIGDDEEEHRERKEADDSFDEEATLFLIGIEESGRRDEMEEWNNNYSSVEAVLDEMRDRDTPTEEFIRCRTREEYIKVLIKDDIECAKGYKMLYDTIPKGLKEELTELLYPGDSRRDLERALKACELFEDVDFDGVCVTLSYGEKE